MPDTSEPLSSQIKRLAQFILDDMQGEPSQNEGAIDTAIRILKQRKADVETLWQMLDDIDTYADALHPPGTNEYDKKYQEMVMTRVKDRFAIRTSDGYKLFMPGHEPAPPETISVPQSESSID